MMGQVPRVELSTPHGRFLVEELQDGRRRLSDPNAQRWITQYPLELIRAIVETKGPAAIDEIKRDEDPNYVALRLHYDLLGYLPPEAFVDRRLLDFGCGAGASTMILARQFPRAEIVGIDLRRDLLDLAESRARHYGHQNARFACSPDPSRLPQDTMAFDYVVLSAVYEHLLPAERPTVLAQLWSALRQGGVLFLNQTPYRWWPVEAHTTRLPALNYLPDRLARDYARLCSRRVTVDESWDQLLRRGIRGGSEREILDNLGEAGVAPLLLEPSQLGFRDRIDLWYCLSTRSRRHPAKLLLRLGLKALKAGWGVTLLPELSLAIHKA